MQCNPRISPPPRDESLATAQGRTRDWLVVKSYTLYRGVHARKQVSLVRYCQKTKYKFSCHGSPLQVITGLMRHLIGSQSTTMIGDFSRDGRKNDALVRRENKIYMPAILSLPAAICASNLRRNGGYYV